MAKDSWAASCLIGINNRIYGPSWCDLLKWHYDAVNERRQPASAPQSAREGREGRQWAGQSQDGASARQPKWVTFADAICYKRKRTERTLNSSINKTPDGPSTKHSTPFTAARPSLRKLTWLKAFAVMPNTSSSLIKLTNTAHHPDWLGWPRRGRTLV